MNVLFLCTGNSCRSQMAEAFGRLHEARGHRIFSAGTSPQGINPMTFKTMAECGIDIGDQVSNDVDDIPVAQLDLVISLCSNAEQNVPEELRGINRVHWPLADPADAEGSEEEKLTFFGEIRDDIRRRVHLLLGA